MARSAKFPAASRLYLLYHLKGLKLTLPKLISSRYHLGGAIITFSFSKREPLQGITSSLKSIITKKILVSWNLHIEVSSGIWNYGNKMICWEEWCSISVYSAQSTYQQNTKNQLQFTKNTQMKKNWNHLLCHLWRINELDVYLLSNLSTNLYLNLINQCFRNRKRRHFLNCLEIINYTINANAS